MLNLNDNEKAVVKKVVETIMQNEGLFAGNYDAVNGSPEFMFGISSLLEYLAYAVDENFGIEIDDAFIKNMLKSEEKC
jgi:hypothetical protein